jgi:hypothetical protein
MSISKNITVIVALMVNLYFTKANFNSDLEVFAQRIEESVNNNNPMFINNCFDFESFLNKIHYIDKPEIAEFNREFREAILTSLKPGNIVTDELVDGCRVKFLAVKQSAKDTLLLFRILTSRGINYHEYCVGYKGQNFSIRDIYMYNNYSSLSSQFSNLYFESIFTSFETHDDNYSKYYCAKSILEQEISKGKNQKAYKRWGRLPENIKTSKQILLLAIKASGNIGENELTQTLNIYIAQFGSDNRSYLIILEDLLITEEYAKALECIDKLSIAVNNDPFLDYYRGQILSKLGNMQKAEWVFNGLINNLPDQQTGYIGLLELYIDNIHYGEATKILSLLKTNFEIYNKDFSIILQAYPDFLCSKEYKNWLDN